MSIYLSLLLMVLIGIPTILIFCALLYKISYMMEATAEIRWRRHNQPRYKEGIKCEHE